jgi:peroxiredoxin
MALTQSTMTPLGTPAPDFSLPEVTTSRIVRLDDFAGKKALLVMFLSRHCPYVKHVESQLAALARDYAVADLGIVAVGANDPTLYPDDAPASLSAQAREVGFNFPYLFDASQSAAKAYRAACTPDFFVFDEKRRLAYRGQLDDSRPGNGKPVTGHDLRAALDAVLEGRPVPSPQRPSAGCSIKWTPGNEPGNFGGK